MNRNGRVRSGLRVAIMLLPMVVMPALATPGAVAASRSMSTMSMATTGVLRVEPGSTMAVTIRKAPGECRAVVELLQDGVVVTDRSALVGADGRATVTIRFPQVKGRYLLQARLGGPRCPEEGRLQPVQQRTVVVG